MEKLGFGICIKEAPLEVSAWSLVNREAGSCPDSHSIISEPLKVQSTPSCPLALTAFVCPHRQEAGRAIRARV